MKNIILSTINAKYTHSSLGLRYLFANLHELKESAEIIEFDPTLKLFQMAERLMLKKPAIIGLSVYIWNAVETANLVNLIKKISPQTVVVLGGPEVSHLPYRVNFDSADYIVKGEGENEFYKLCKSVLNNKLPVQKVISVAPVNTKEIELPYKYYNDEDIANRVIYVEASRGCPFRCEFCLSSIDKEVRPFAIDIILDELQTLWERGARKFKFVDRTFNVSIDTAVKVMDFFIDKTPPYLAHFEVIPEHFPEKLKEKIKMFPPASLQLEIGIQTLNKNVAENISRKLNIDKIKQNITFLQNETNAYLHLDLIIGLPGESIESFADNLNYLVELTDSEIQLGILKKLSGTTINRHDEKYKMVYSNLPPYEILMNDRIDFLMMQKMKRFARFWDLTYNSGNFLNSVKLIWEDKKVYDGFYDFSEWIYAKTESTWRISLNRMAELLFNFLVECNGISKDKVAEIISGDIKRFPGRRLPAFLKEHAGMNNSNRKSKLNNINKRQIKHL